MLVYMDYSLYLCVIKSIHLSPFLERDLMIRNRKLRMKRRDVIYQTVEYKKEQLLCLT